MKKVAGRSKKPPDLSVTGKPLTLFNQTKRL